VTLTSSNDTEILGNSSPSPSSERPRSSRPEAVSATEKVAHDRRTKFQDDVVRIARSWIGTPYHHQMAVKGAGCDCLGLVRGVYAELYGKPTEEPPPYSRDWAEATGQETLLDAADRHMIPRYSTKRECRSGLVWPGDVLIFRMNRIAMAKHAAIATSPISLIHAFEDNAVCEVPISSWWNRRIAGVYYFPHSPEILGDALPSSSSAREVAHDRTI
jgi:NlpC/P60 family putative phage cell wall peptidase